MANFCQFEFARGSASMPSRCQWNLAGFKDHPAQKKHSQSPDKPGRTAAGPKMDMKYTESNKLSFARTLCYGPGDFPKKSPKGLFKWHGV